MDGETLADFHARDAGAKRGDLAGDVAAENERRLGDGQAFADPQVEMVQRAGAHAQDNLAGAGDGIGQSLENEVLRAAEVLQDDRFHGGILQ